MSKKVLWVVLILGSYLCAEPGLSLAAHNIQGTVGNITAKDGLNLGRIGCRVWSTQYPTINANVGLGPKPECFNDRCLQPYRSQPLLQPGGYVCHGENTAPYDTDADGQTFYQLVDGQVYEDVCNHIAFYAVQGLVASSIQNPSGDFRQQNCPGVTATNCFERADTRHSRPVPLMGTYASYGGPNQITSIGGLSPVPTVRIDWEGCPSGNLRLTWDDPETYQDAMKNGVASPVKGVRLYANFSDCSSCPDSSSGWVALGDFPMGAGPIGICYPWKKPVWFALTVLLHGPNTIQDPASEVETGHSPSASFVGANSYCAQESPTVVRVPALGARYVGRGTVSVSFTTGVGGDVLSYAVTRATSPNGPFSRISPPILPIEGRSDYSFSDKVRPALGRTLYYAVEIVSRDGSTERTGPVGVNLPAAKRRLVR